MERIEGWVDCLVYLSHSKLGVPGSQGSDNKCSWTTH